MFEHVQKKLAVLYTAMTGAVLLLLLSLLFAWNLGLRRQEERIAFQSLWMTVTNQFQMNHAMSDAYLAHTEASHQAILHIEENGQAFFFPGSWTPESPRTSLIELAMETAADEGIFPDIPPVSESFNQTSEFQIRGRKGDSYYGRLLVLPSAKGARSLLLLSRITPLFSLFGQLVPLFAFAAVLGIVCIYFVSLFLTGRALLPAREAAARQAEFIAAASHELRSPLAVIRSSCFAALQETAPAPSPARLLSNIERECSRMARLVSDMLLLASADAGTWTLHPEELEADTLLMDAYETFLPICRQKNIALTIRLPEEALPRFRGDRQRMEQVLAILLDNALSYTPEGRSVFLSLSLVLPSHRFGSSCPFLAFEVSDSGPGIPDDKKKKIFDRFYRADSSRTEKKHFGLGLSIAKELIALHKGTIRVLDRPGGGSRFIIYLPAADSSCSLS